MSSLRIVICTALVAFGVAFAAPALAQQTTPPSPAPTNVVSPGPTASGSATASASASPSASSTAAAKKPGPPILGGGNWSKYMAITMAGIAALVLLAFLAGLAIQGPGFRKVGDGQE